MYRYIAVSIYIADHYYQHHARSADIAITETQQSELLPGPRLFFAYSNLNTMYEPTTPKSPSN